MPDSREEALRVMDAMFARTSGNGPLDRFPLEGIVYDFAKQLTQNLMPFSARCFHQR